MNRVVLLLVVLIPLCGMPERAAGAITTVMQAKVSFSGNITGHDTRGRRTIKPFTLNNKVLINLAMGRAIESAVPASEILALAGDDALLLTGDPTAEITLVVFDTDAKAILRTIAVVTPGSMQIAESHFPAFKRHGSAEVTLQEVGSPAHGIDDGTLQLVAIVTAKLTPDGFVPSTTIAATGRMNLHLGFGPRTLFILKSRIVIRGDPIRLP